MRFTIAAHLFDEIISHAKAASPNEGCGLIAGRNGMGERFIVMRNMAGRPDRYEMDPADLVRALRELRTTGEELMAICHSHPSGPATPSARDINEASYPEAVQIIVSLETPERPLIRAYRIRDGRVSDVELSAMV